MDLLLIFPLTSIHFGPTIPISLESKKIRPIAANRRSIFHLRPIMPCPIAKHELLISIHKCWRGAFQQHNSFLFRIRRFQSISAKETGENSTPIWKSINPRGCERFRRLCTMNTRSANGEMMPANSLPSMNEGLKLQDDMIPCLKKKNPCFWKKNSMFLKKKKS